MLSRSKSTLGKKINESIHKAGTVHKPPRPQQPQQGPTVYPEPGVPCLRVGHRLATGGNGRDENSVSGSLDTAALGPRSNPQMSPVLSWWLRSVSQT